MARRPREHYHVYVVELDDRVWNNARFRRCNPDYRLGMPFVYVGMTGLDPDVRFDKHKAGIQANTFVREHGVRPEVSFEFDNIENIKKAVEVGSGVALLPEPTIRQEIQAGTLLSLKLDGVRMVRPLGIIHRRQHQFSGTTLAFLDLLRSNGAAAGLNGHRSA